MSKEKSTGIVKWFDNSKGYGFIVNENGEDVFVHYRSIISDADYKTLKEGQRVLFTQIKSEKGWQGVEVERDVSDVDGNVEEVNGNVA